MAKKRNQDHSSLETVVESTGGVLETVSNITGEVAQKASRLTHSVRETVADTVGNVSPTAAELIRPAGGKRSSAQSGAQAIRRQAGKGMAKASEAVNRNARKAAGTTVRTTSAATPSKKATKSGPKRGR